MRLHFLVEGPSEKRLLDELLPRLIPQHSFRVYPHQGKGRLPADPTKPPDPVQRGVLDQLPAKLRAWGRTFSPDTDRVVVLVDADDEDCTVLLKNLRNVLEGIDPAPQCLFRIAIEEVEAWFLGDWAAIKRAFPSARRNVIAEYAPDSRCKTWELFQQAIGDRIERKPYWAEKMGATLSVQPAENKSPSYRKFCEGVLGLVGEPAAERPTPKRRVTRSPRSFTR